MKRTVLIGLLVAVLVFPVMAQGAREAAKEEGPVVLKVWGGVPEENGPGALIAEFERQNPNIKIDYNRFVNDDQGNLRLDTALIAGNQVDVFFTYRNDVLVRRAESGNALSLSDIAAKDGFDLKKEFGDLSYATVKDQIFALPTNKGPQFFMVNKDMFDAAGIDLPTSWTAEEFRDVARRLSSGSGQNRVYGVMYPSWPQLHILGAQSTLGPNAFMDTKTMTSNFKNPLFAKSIDLRKTMSYQDMSEIPYVEVVSQNLSDATEFLTGRVAMIYTGTWRIRNVRDLKAYPHDFITAFVPYYSMDAASDRLYNEGSLGDWAMIAKGTKHADAAWKFIKYWATVGADPMVELGGKIPAWTQYPAEKVTKTMLGEDAEALFDVASFENVILNAPFYSYQPTDPVGIKIYNDVRKSLQEEVELYFINRQTLDQTINALDRRTNDLIKFAK